jgi:hypothetical protein
MKQPRNSHNLAVLRDNCLNDLASSERLVGLISRIVRYEDGSYEIHPERFRLDLMLPVLLQLALGK